jgi:hypothetical protein
MPQLLLAIGDVLRGHGLIATAAPASHYEHNPNERSRPQ